MKFFWRIDYIYYLLCFSGTDAYITYPLAVLKNLLCKNFFLSKVMQLLGTPWPGPDLSRELTTKQSLPLYQIIFPLHTFLALLYYVIWRMKNSVIFRKSLNGARQNVSRKLTKLGKISHLYFWHCSRIKYEEWKKLKIKNIFY